MKNLWFCLCLVSTCAFAQDGAFRFGIDKGMGKIGNYDVKSCEILIPYFGEQTGALRSQLEKKGYRPIVESRIEPKGASFIVSATAEFKENPILHDDLALTGIPFLTGEFSASMVYAHTSLTMGVVGEPGAGLFRSSKYTVLPERQSAVFYSAESFPDCEMGELGRGGVRQ